jgi:hypothetical protein
MTVSSLLSYVRLSFNNSNTVNKCAAVRSGELEGHWMSPNWERTHQGECSTQGVHWESCFFLLGYMKAQIFIHTLSDITTLKNAIRQQIANVTQDTVRRVMTSLLWRWQQCLDCHGGHHLDVVLKTWSFFLWIQDTDLLKRVQLYFLLCAIKVLSYFQNR